MIFFLFGILILIYEIIRLLDPNGNTIPTIKHSKGVTIIGHNGWFESSLAFIYLSFHIGYIVWVMIAAYKPYCLGGMVLFITYLLMETMSIEERKHFLRIDAFISIICILYTLFHYNIF